MKFINQKCNPFKAKQDCRGLEPIAKKGQGYIKKEVIKVACRGREP